MGAGRRVAQLVGGQATVIAGASIANKSGIPDGALHPASWLMPPKAGGMSARYTAALAVDAWPGRGAASPPRAPRRS